MTEIVELSDEIAKSSRSKSKTLTYSIDIGTASTLFYIAIKCRASVIGWRAINLLLHTHDGKALGTVS